nr:MAG: DNA pilot protein [Microvirus sp.]
MGIWDSLVSAGTSILGGVLGGDRQDKAAETQYQHQKEFAQNAIQYKVADATAAGINPYYALGATTTSYSPTTVGDGGIGKGLSDASQDIGRAAAATQTAEEKTSDFTKKAQALSLTKSGLENELLATQLAKQRSQIGPPVPGLNKNASGQPAVDVSPDGEPIKNKNLENQNEAIPKHKTARTGGLRLDHAPWSSDAEDIETRYGDTAEELQGAANIVSDAGYTLHKRIGYPHIYGRSARRNWKNAIRGIGSYYGNNEIY